MEEKSKRIEGKYVIIAAVIGLIGTFGGILLNHILTNNSSESNKKNINYPVVSGHSSESISPIDLNTNLEVSLNQDPKREDFINHEIDDTKTNSIKKNDNQHSEPDPYYLDLIFDSRHENIDGIITSKERLEIVHNLPSVKTIIIPQLNTSYHFGIIMGSDTLWCQEKFITPEIKNVTLSCN